MNATMQKLGTPIKGTIPVSFGRDIEIEFIADGWTAQQVFRGLDTATLEVRTAEDGIRGMGRVEVIDSTRTVVASGRYTDGDEETALVRLEGDISDYEEPVEGESVG